MYKEAPAYNIGVAAEDISGALTTTTIKKMITQDQLKQLIPGNQFVNEWCDCLNGILPDYEVDTPLRLAAFIAQCSTESGHFTTVEENLNYRWETLRRVFPKYFPTDKLAQEYASKPNRQEAIANRVYANRMGNGDERSGDGWKYRGRGLIQVTGKNNYQAFADSLEIPIEEATDYLTTFEGAVQSACWFWEANDLNKYADSRDIRGMTRVINGGFNGLDERLENYQHALKVLGV